MSSTTIDSGYTHSCAVLSDASVKCWGRNDQGQLGDGTKTSRPTPVTVKGAGGVGVLTSVTTLSVFRDFSCAVRSDGTAWCWGQNDKGQLGNGTNTDSVTPVQVVGAGGAGFLSGVVSVAAGEKQACARTTAGAVWCWGENNQGQLGDGTRTNRSTPAPVHGPEGVGFLAGVASLDAGHDHLCAVRSDGTLWCWGDNADGKLGDGTTTDRDTPVQVLGAGGSGSLTNVTEVDGGERHTCAVRTDGTVWCWGKNDHGQLGNADTTDVPTPVQVRGIGGAGFLAGAVRLGLGRNSSCAIVSDATVRCWGDNSGGRLGDGTTLDRTTPVVVLGVGGSGTLSGVRYVTGGQDVGNSPAMTCAIGTTTAWCWGTNQDGALGDGTTTNRPTPGLVLL